MRDMDSPLNSASATAQELATCLQLRGDGQKMLLEQAKDVKAAAVGDKVYFRGLVEFSNVCARDCLYCGIRKSNSAVERYVATDEEILSACQFALDNGYGSVVLQSGELTSRVFVDRVDSIVRRIRELSADSLGITLSCGVQEAAVYRRWRDSGAHRYLLRIEASRRSLYYRLHPNDADHAYGARLEALRTLRAEDYQVGTGVMIGLPFQTVEDLANDLLFFREMDVDMVGMGPYVEHTQTPLHEHHAELPSPEERLALSFNMIACLRILIPDINIAAATALQALDPIGREKAVSAGANVIMPNLTPCEYRKDYKLYENKPCVDEDASQCRNCLESRVQFTGNQIALGQRGDSLHYQRRKTMCRSE